MGLNNNIGSATVPRSEVWAVGGSGFGSTGTAVRCFTTTIRNTGTDITYLSDAVNGDTFTINTTGVYTYNSLDYSTLVTSEAGASINASSTSTVIGSLANTQIWGDVVGVTTVRVGSSGTCILHAGDVVRAQTNGMQNETSATYVYFKICKVSN